MLNKWKLCALLLTITQAMAQEIIREEDLRAKPELLHEVMSQAVLNQQQDLVEALLPLYQVSEIKDDLLADYAEALVRHHRGEMEAAITRLQDLNRKEALPPFQFQLAQWQYQNHAYADARETLQTLAQDEALPEDLAGAAQGLSEALKRKEAWKFNGLAYYRYDSNVHNAPHVRQHQGWEFDAPQKAHGITLEASARRDWLWGNHLFTPLYIDVDGEFYHKVKSANDLRLRVESGLGWRNARHEYSLRPFLQRRILGQRNYSLSYGAQALWQIRPTPQWQFRLSQQTSYENHDRRKHLNGWRFYQALSAYHQFNPERYYLGGFSHYYYDAQQKDDRYHLWSAYLGVGQSWQDWQLNGRYTLQLRQHQGLDLFQIKRRDIEHRLRLGIAHQGFNWRGIEPELVLQAKRVDSNHFYYDRPWRISAQVEFSKRF